MDLAPWTQLQVIPWHGKVKVVISTTYEYLVWHILEKRHWLTIIEDSITIIQARRIFFFPYTCTEENSTCLKTTSRFNGAGQWTNGPWTFQTPCFQTFDLSPIPSQKDESTYESFSKTPVHVTDIKLATESLPVSGRKRLTVFGWIPKWRTAQEEDDYCQLILLRLEALDSYKIRLDGS